MAMRTKSRPTAEPAPTLAGPAVTPETTAGGEVPAPSDGSRADLVAFAIWLCCSCALGFFLLKDLAWAFIP